VREFVAVEVGPADARADRAPQHLTLRFLGEVDPARTPELERTLAGVAAGFRPIPVRLEGVGAFPSVARPRVVWVGVTTGRDELVALARAVREALAWRFGRDDEEFVPHVTMFRVRSPQDRQVALELLQGVRPPPSAREVTVRELLLKESLLQPRGAVHRTLASFPLGAPRGG
jgi:RNA 2',3'-cyclic 3'-phosphodiesterase